LEKGKLPWAFLCSGKGWDSPTALYYGISSIPTMILVGKDGKVVSTAARGDALNGLLERLLERGSAGLRDDQPSVGR
jgi:hypothetical protein